MGTDREKYCDYCKNYISDYDLCRLTGRKPSFESECTNYNEKEGVVKPVPTKSPKRKKNPSEQKTYNVFTLILGIASVVILFYYRVHIVDWVKELFAPEEKREYVDRGALGPVHFNRAVKEFRIPRGHLPGPATLHYDKSSQALDISRCVFPEPATRYYDKSSQALDISRGAFPETLVIELNDYWPDQKLPINQQERYQIITGKELHYASGPRCGFTFSVTRP